MPGNPRKRSHVAGALTQTCQKCVPQRVEDERPYRFSVAVRRRGRDSGTLEETGSVPHILDARHRFLASSDEDSPHQGGPLEKTPLGA